MMPAQRKTSNYIRFALMVFTALALTFVGNQANAQVFGVKFLGETTDGVTGTAGAIAVSGWNNIDNDGQLGSPYTSGKINAANGSSVTAILTLSDSDFGWHRGTPS